MRDVWQLWADAWDAWDAAGLDRSARDDFSGYDLWKSDIGPWPSSWDDPRPKGPHTLSTERRTVKDLTTHETTLRAAQQLLETGPFWLLDLWKSLSPSRQRDVVKTLVEQPTFTVALRAVGFVRRNPLGLTDEDLDEVIAAVGGKP